MKAVVFHGIGDIRLDDVPEPPIVEPNDAIVQMLVPGSAIVTMFLGAVVDWYWRRTSPGSAERSIIPPASGFIARRLLQS